MNMEIKKSEITDVSHKKTVRCNLGSRNFKKKKR